MAESNRPLRVGMIGAGEVSQVIHLPVLALLSHLYTTTAICDISLKNAQYCAIKFHIPLATTDPTHIFNSPEVDVVFVLTSDEFHEPCTIAALQADKHIMVEKPFTLSLPSAQRIVDAEAKANGPVVIVGYMRRYAKSFTQTFKREMQNIGTIKYARVRDFSGPNAKFVRESGTFQVRNMDDIPRTAGEERDTRLDGLYQEVFPNQQPVTVEKIHMCRLLGSLGSHDLSLMREVLGFPESVAGVTAYDPFYSAIFNYRNNGIGGGGEPFAVTYESGVDGVPDFDAHLAVYGEKKRVLIQYDSPYVKGLPIKVMVQEMNEAGEMEVREMLGSYEDAYTAELQKLYECVVHGRKVKTTAKDAMEDMRLYDMMYRKWDEGQTSA